MKKKRINRVLGIILAIMLPIAIIGGTITGMMLYTREGFNQGISSTPQNTIEQEYDAVDTIRIDEMVDSIEIVPTDSEKVKVTYSGVHEIDINTSGKELKVKGKGNTVFGFSNGRWWNLSDAFQQAKDDTNETLKIEVPKTVRILDLDSSVGNVTVANLKLENLEISAGVGEHIINDVEVTKMVDIDGGVGHMNINRLSGSPIVKIESGVGSMNMNIATVKTMEINGGVGNTELSEVKADSVDIDGGLGDINIRKSVITTLSGDRGLGSVSISDSDIKNNKFGFGDMDS